MTNHSLVGWLVLGLLALAGCENRGATPPVTETTSSSGPVEYSEVELSDLVVRYDDNEPNLVHFEFKYRFTKGQPTYHYHAEVKFPGTNIACMKPIENYELEESGTVHVGMFAESLPLPNEFEIDFKESFSPMTSPFKVISNLLKGTMKAAESQPSGESGGK